MTAGGARAAVLAGRIEADAPLAGAAAPSPAGAGALLESGPEPNPYERPQWRAARDGLLRPGGLELTDRAIAFCALPTGGRVWDVGCGPGTTVAHLIARHGLSAGGIDRSEALLDEARRRAPGATLHCASGHELPCETGSLDAVLAECSWSAMSTGKRPATEGDDGPLAEFRRVLRPGGWLIMSDVYARNSTGSGPAIACDGRWGRLSSESEIRTAVAASGFSVELWEDHSSALRSFVGRMIFAHGSLDSLWGDAPIRPDDRAALLAARPGYFLLIARRN